MVSFCRGVLRSRELRRGVLRSSVLRSGVLWLGSWVFTSGCLERPVGTDQPRTTNVVISEFRYDPVTQIDLLFMIDNSRSMADKQVLFAEALPDLVGALVDPPCLGVDGAEVEALSDDACPAGSAREFRPVRDLHIGVITSSLGGYGAPANCVDDGTPYGAEVVDMAHLIGSLPRGQVVAPAAAETGFLAWSQGVSAEDQLSQFRGLVQAAGERGCGWEASLESWYRFLIEPFPYKSLVRKACSASDTRELCVGPKLDAQGAIELDTELLAQRARFLRPNSLLAIVLLTDENDCSFKANGRTLMLAQSATEQGQSVPAYRPTSACSDPAQGPNSECCHSCWMVPPEGCPTEIWEQDGKPPQTVGVGCGQGLRYPANDPNDASNLRCYDQKRRFGVDLLYPVERYSNALKLPRLCPFADTLEPTAPECPEGAGVVDNPLFSDLSGAAVVSPPRLPSRVFLAGVLGVPWQDLAVSADPGEPLVYRNNRGTSPEPERIDWSWLLPSQDDSGGTPPPRDPLMIETPEPRTGVNPATGYELADTNAGYAANPINGHEWLIDAKGFGPADLQYACTFPLAQPVLCPTPEELEELEDNGEYPPECDCTEHGAAEFKNPLCQGPDGEYGQTQYFAKAYPGVRELEVLRAFGDNSIVASICPKSVDTNAKDYGYRPAMAAIIERLKEGLQDQCYQRQLAVRPDDSVACIVVEAKAPEPGVPTDCSALGQRKPVSEAVAKSVRKQLLIARQCATEAACEALSLCEIEQLTSSAEPDAHQSCLNDEIPRGDGWCYIDKLEGIGNPALVEQCPETSQRKLRFVGAGTPRPGSVTVVACAGKTFD